MVEILIDGLSPPVDVNTDLDSKILGGVGQRMLGVSSVSHYTVDASIFDNYIDTIDASTCVILYFFSMIKFFFNFRKATVSTFLDINPKSFLVVK